MGGERLTAAQRALSIQQPWAWLIVNGHKRVENRTWHTAFRGPLFIHAGLRFDREGFDWVRHRFPEIRLPAKAQFERGGVVGFATMAGCVNRRPNDPWFFGPWGFELANAGPLPFMPMAGALGLFKVEVDPEIDALIADRRAALASETSHGG